MARHFERPHVDPLKALFSDWKGHLTDQDWRQPAGEAEDSGGLIVTFGGEANAVGTETLAEGDLFSRVVDTGPVTLAYGSASFTATAQGPKGQTFASTDTFFDFAGADFVWIYEDTSSSSWKRGGQTVTTETSTLKFLAIDIENWEPADGPVMIEVTSPWQLGWGGSWGGCWGRKPPALSGNVATLGVDAEADGTNTLVDVGSSVLTVEDQLSTAAGIVTTGVA